MTELDIWKRKILNFVVTLGLVFVFLNLFIYIKSFAAEAMLRYPPTLECDTFDKMFVDKVDEYKKYALYDKPHTLKGTGHGTGYF